MIPLRDDIKSQTFPLVNYVLIALNALAFMLELGMGEQLERFLYQAAVVPVLYTGRDHALSVVEAVRGTVNPELGLRLLFSIFLHGGWAHIIGNMLYLWIFGDNIEDRVGHFKYVLFYLLCGWIASYAHILSNPDSRVPAIGASGAIAGVLGAYLTLYPHAHVVTLLPLGFFTQIVRIPALFFLGFWFLQQFLMGAMSLGADTAQTGGVAWWAHIGGFAAGVVLVRLFGGVRRPVRAVEDHWWEDGRRVSRGRWR
jgi:membrane associated rhomboid family serine protease